MNNITRDLPPNACAYVAMEHLLGREINDQHWLQLIRTRGATNMADLQLIFAPRYDCLYLPQFIFYTDIRKVYHDISCPQGEYWVKSDCKVMVTHYRDKRRKVPLHTLTVPAYAVPYINKLHSIVIRNQDIVEYDSSQEAIDRYFSTATVKDR